MNVQDIINKIECMAPPWLADEGDPIGLQVGNRHNSATSVVVTVDITPSIVAQAIKIGADMIISHHALIYSPIRSLERTDARMDAIAKLVAKDIAVFVAHTNYDCAIGGINDVLAETLGVTQTRVLVARKTDRLFKIAVFTPHEAVDAVRAALSSAGAGAVGNYAECSFRAPGIGSFKPLKGAEPYIGQVGRLEEVEEYRLEMLVPESLLSQAIEAMRAVHPYEEVAYDIYRLENPPITYGLGRIGNLERPMSLSEFSDLIEERLGVQGLRMVGDKNRSVQKVAVCGGGGDFLIPNAYAAGADVYVTGTAGYHQMLDADMLGLAFIDAGHFETERPGMKTLAQRLGREFAGESVSIVYVE